MTTCGPRSTGQPAVQSPMSPQEFYRIRRLPPYVFAEVNAMKAAARARGEDVIDLGMGNPDAAPPQHVIDKLTETLKNPRVHGYSSSRGVPGLRKAYAAYYARRFNVELDPESEIIVTLGSKEGFANFAQAITAPGDTVLVPNPCYPIHSFGFIMAGAAIRHVQVGPNTDFMAGLKRAMRGSVPPPIALVVNYPANPTAEVVDLDFYREVVAFARKHEILLLSDVAYSEVYYGDDPPPSILQVPGAKEVAIEFSSLSKTYNMAGWRLGMAVGNAEAIDALYVLKSQIDTSHFLPIQEAGVAALSGDQAWTQERNGVYRQRRDAVLEGARQIGMQADTPRAAMYVWAGLPAGETSSTQFCDRLLEATGVSVTPGTAFGEGGEGYVRFSLATPVERIREAMGRMIKWRGP